MSRTIAALMKRRAKPVQLGEETIYVRTFTHREAKDYETIPDADLKAFYMLGSGLVEEDGTPCIAREDGESAEAFATRASQILEDIPLDVVQDAISGMVQGKVPSVETIAGN